MGVRAIKFRGTGTAAESIDLDGQGHDGDEERDGAVVDQTVEATDLAVDGGTEADVNNSTEKQRVGKAKAKSKKPAAVSRGAASQSSTSRGDSLINLRACAIDDEVVIITKKGLLIRQKVADISSQSRLGTGVVIQKIPSDDFICAVDIVPS